MKSAKILFIALLLCFVATGSICATQPACATATEQKTKASNDTTVVFTVEPRMSCHNCENRIKNNLRFEKGVKRIDASAKEQCVTVVYDRRKTDTSKLIDAFKKIGYTAKTKTSK